MTEAPDTGAAAWGCRVCSSRREPGNSTLLLMSMTVARMGFTVVALMSVAGCTGSSGTPILRSSPPVPAVTPSTVATSPPSAGAVNFPTSPDDLCAPRPGASSPPPPTGFLARSSTVRVARWCVRGVPSHGKPSQVVQLVQSTGDVTAVDRALHAPRPTPLAINKPCLAIAFVAPVVEVLDQYGRLYRPTVPTSRCGDPAATQDALAATAYTVLSSPAPPVR